MHCNFLFDLDQTLLNFHASEYVALKTVVNSNGYEFNDELYSYFKARNKELWLEYEKKIITRTELFETRFRLLFEKCGEETQKLELLKINDNFISEMSRNGVLLDGALELLQKLKTKIHDSRIYVITNGAEINAKGRIKSTGIDKYLDGIFVSETMGTAKPSPDFFDIVLNTVNEPKSSCIVIGDSLSSDMLGAKNAGLSSCWFMPEGDTEKAMQEYEIDFTASSFEDLYGVLKNWAAASA